MAEETEKLKLPEAITHLLEECRMVLPGVQALFGFQLIVVFNNGFVRRLAEVEQILHLVALALVAISGALIMTPAALHRQSGAREASERFLRVGGGFLLASMPPLMLGIGIDFFLIAHMVLDDAAAAAAAAAVLVGIFVYCWFVFPRAYRRRFHQR
jgi:Family of unknown function (DUF6328)